MVPSVHANAATLRTGSERECLKTCNVRRVDIQAQLPQEIGIIQNRFGTYLGV